MLLFLNSLIYGFISPMFTKHKKDGTYHMILSLTVEYHHLKMESIRSVILMPVNVAYFLAIL